MVKQLLLFAALTSALTFPAHSLAKPKKTPDQLITELVDKKKAEIDSLRVADELNWFSITLLNPPTVEEAYKLPKGTSVHSLGPQGVWDKVELEAADNEIVSVAFSKTLANMSDGSAFEASLKEHISKRLGPSKFNSRFKSTSWSLVKEADFVKRWQDYYRCLIQNGDKLNDVLVQVVCKQQPEQERITDKLSSVFYTSWLTETLKTHVVLRVTAVAYNDALTRERERKKSEFGQQLEDGGTSN